MIVPKKRVLTIKEAASLIDGLTPFRVRQIVYRSCRATASGQLPCFKAGRKYLIYEENLYKVVLCEGRKATTMKKSKKSQIRY